MSDVTQRWNRAVLKRRLTMMGLVFAIVWLGNGVWSAYQKEQLSAQMRSEQEKKLALLEGRRDDLQKQLASLETVQGREDALRQQFQVAKPGEGLVIFIDPAATSATPVENQPKPKSWWESLFSW